MIFLKFWEKYKNDFLPILLLLGLSFYAWHFLPSWIIQFEGFFYITPGTVSTYLKEFGFWGFLTLSQAIPTVIGAMLSRLVEVNISLYMWIQLIFVLHIGMLFYFVVKVVAKNRFIAFCASLIFSVSYFGNFNMYVVNYSNFLERASVNVIFLLISLLFLQLFLEREKKKYYIISVISYFFGIFSSHYSIFPTSFYFFYPLFWNIFNKKNMLQGFAIGMSYVLVSGFFVFLSSIGSEPVLQRHVGFLQFLLDPQKYRYPEGMLLQLVYWSQYPSIIKAMLSNVNPMSFFSYDIAAVFKVPILAVYAITVGIVYKSLIRERALLLAIIFTTPLVFLLNIYVGRYDPFYTAGTHRTLYFPSYFLAIFWSFFLWVLFKNKNLVLKIIALVLLSGYYYANVYLISIHSSRIMSDARSQKIIFNYIINNRDKLNQNTLVTGPYPELAAEYEAPFFTNQLGRGGVRYMVDTINVTDWRTVATISSHVIHLRFDAKCQCVVEEKIK